MPRDTKLDISLLAMRWTIAAFMLVWAIDKVVNVKHAQGIFAAFYFWKEASPQILMAIDLVQCVILLAFAGGLWRFWTYSAVMRMHAGSTISNLGKIISPYASGSNLLSWVGVPVLGAIFALFTLRDRDRIFALSQS